MVPSRSEASTRRPKYGDGRHLPAGDVDVRERTGIGRRIRVTLGLKDQRAVRWQVLETRSTGGTGRQVAWEAMFGPTVMVLGEPCPMTIKVPRWSVGTIFRWRWPSRDGGDEGAASDLRRPTDPTAKTLSVATGPRISRPFLPRSRNRSLIGPVVSPGGQGVGVFGRRARRLRRRRRGRRATR